MTLKDDNFHTDFFDSKHSKIFLSTSMQPTNLNLLRNYLINSAYLQKKWNSPNKICIIICPISVIVKESQGDSLLFSTLTAF